MSSKAKLRPAGLWTAITVSIGLFIAQTLSLRGYISSDFDIFYDAAKRSLHNVSRLYDAGWNDISTLQGFLYPPPSALAFVPLLTMAKPVAFVVFSALALLAAVVSIWLWLRLMLRHSIASLGRLDIAALISLAIVTAPVFVNRGGQIGTIILLCSVAGVVLGSGRYGWIGGAFLALGGWIKIYPGLLLLAMPLHKDWSRAAIGFVVAAVAIPLLSLVVIPAEMYQQYFSFLLPTMSGRAIINIDNQSLAAVWLRMQDTGIDPLISYAALAIPRPVSAIIALAALMTIAAFVWRTRAMAVAFVPVSAVIMALIGPIAPLGWGHSYVFMLPALVMALALAWEAHAYPALLAGLAAWGIVVVPSHRPLPPWIGSEAVEILFYARYPLAVAIVLGVLWHRLGNTSQINRQSGG